MDDGGWIFWKSDRFGFGAPVISYWLLWMQLSRHLIIYRFPFCAPDGLTLMHFWSAIVDRQQALWRRKTKQLNSQTARDRSTMRQTLNCVINMISKNLNAPLPRRLLDTIPNDKRNKNHRQEWSEHCISSFLCVKRNEIYSNRSIGGGCAVPHGPQCAFNFIFSFINTCCRDI